MKIKIPSYIKNLKNIYKNINGLVSRPVNPTGWPEHDPLNYQVNGLAGQKPQHKPVYFYVVSGRAEIGTPNCMSFPHLDKLSFWFIERSVYPQ